MEILGKKNIHTSNFFYNLKQIIYIFKYYKNNFNLSEHWRYIQNLQVYNN
jgi:hypothetical protein